MWVENIDNMQSLQNNTDALDTIQVGDNIIQYFDIITYYRNLQYILTLKVLVATIDAQWEGMGDVGSVRYEPALLPPCPTIRVLSYSN